VATVGERVVVRGGELGVELGVAKGVVMVEEPAAATAGVRAAAGGAGAGGAAGAGAARAGGRAAGAGAATAGAATVAGGSAYAVSACAVSANAVCADGGHGISSAGDLTSWERAGGAPSPPATFRLATHRGYFPESL